MAESIEIERFFADKSPYLNTGSWGKQAVYALVDSSEEKVEAFVEIVSSKFPEKSDVEKVDAADYSGNVMRIESYYRYLTAMLYDLWEIGTQIHAAEVQNIYLTLRFIIL